MSQADPPKKNRPAATGRRNLNSSKLYDSNTSIATIGRCQSRVRTDRELGLLALDRQVAAGKSAIYLPPQYGTRALRVTSNVVDPLSQALVGVRQAALFPRPSRALDLDVSAGTDGGVGSDIVRALRQVVAYRELLDRCERWLVFSNPWFAREGDRDFAKWQESGLTEETLAIQSAIIRRDLNDNQLDFLVERMDVLCGIGERLIDLCFAPDGKTLSKAGAVNG